MGEVCSFSDVDAAAELRFADSITQEAGRELHLSQRRLFLQAQLRLGLHDWPPRECRGLRNCGGARGWQGGVDLRGEGEARGKSAGK